MEQLWAIWCCSRPRSYRRRSTSLILRMDRPFCGIQLLLWLEEKAEAGCPAPLFTPNRKHDPAMSISIRVRPASFAADIHSCGIPIHIVRNTHTKQVTAWRAAGLLRGHLCNEKDEYLYEDPGPDPPRKAKGVRLSKRVRFQNVSQRP